jgi:plastocyanin
VSTVGKRATRRALTGIIAAVMVLGLAGCGNGGDDDNVLGSAGKADVRITDQGFEPDELEVRVGEEVRFTIANEDDRPHTFTLTFLEIDQEIAPDSTADITLKATQVPDAGFYSFYSKNHQGEGYQGRIKVVQ